MNRTRRDPWETGKLGRSIKHARVADDEDLPMTPQQIGALLRERRKSLGKTQKEVADWIGVTKGAVSHWENGRVEGINTIHLYQVAKLLQIEESVVQRFRPHPFVVPLPQIEIAVMHLYAMLPEKVRQHVRGIIEALSKSQRESQ
jgi:transcriptional regulator with XRE-family HTH domain